MLDETNQICFDVLEAEVRMYSAEYPSLET